MKKYDQQWADHLYAFRPSHLRQLGHGHPTGTPRPLHVGPPSNFRAESLLGNTTMWPRGSAGLSISDALRCNLTLDAVYRKSQAVSVATGVASIDTLWGVRFAFFKRSAIPCHHRLLCAHCRQHLAYPQAQLSSSLQNLGAARPTSCTLQQHDCLQRLALS